MKLLGTLFCCPSFFPSSICDYIFSSVSSYNLILIHSLLQFDDDMPCAIKFFTLETHTFYSWILIFISNLFNNVLSVSGSCLSWILDWSSKFLSLIIWFPFFFLFYFFYLGDFLTFILQQHFCYFSFIFSNSSVLWIPF